MGWFKRSLPQNYQEFTQNQQNESMNKESNLLHQHHHMKMGREEGKREMRGRKGFGHGEEKKEEKKTYHFYSHFSLVSLTSFSLVSLQNDLSEKHYGTPPSL